MSRTPTCNKDAFRKPVLRKPVLRCVARRHSPIGHLEHNLWRRPLRQGSLGQPTAAPGLYPVLRGARLFQAERPDLASCQGGRSSRGRAVWQNRPARVRPFRVCELALTGELLRYSLSGVRTSLVMRGQRPAPPMPSTLKLGTVVLTKLDLEYNCMINARGNQAVRDAVKDRSGFVLHLSLYRVGRRGTHGLRTLAGSVRDSARLGRAAAQNILKNFLLSG